MTIQEKVEQWLKWDTNEKTRKEIQDLVAAGNEAELKKRLEGRIAFGTAGLRGAMQAGFTGMNDLTVIQASQGLAQIVKGFNKPVCVGRDGRHNSERFAQLTAATLVKAGVPVYYFRGLVPTPLVAYTVKKLELCAGVMITASHNPKDDNGYKVYWDCGSQIVSPVDAQIQKSILENLEPWDISEQLRTLEESTLNPLPDLANSYYADVFEKCCFFHEENKQSTLKIVYTAMHGVGKVWSARAFETFGLPPYIPVAEQLEADPDFPTVPFPNPEEGEGALHLSIQTADREGANIIIANDPDADRFTAAEKQPNGQWKLFSGNELGILLGDWAWTNFHRTHPEVAPGDCVVLNTTVSSKMLQALAQKEGLIYEETLTGFKWMGNLAQQKIREGKTFLFSFEDAIGFMIFDICLDKDGVRTAAMFTEMANQLYTRNISINQHLESLYDKYGYYATQNKYFFCYDPEKMKSIFDRIRQMDEGSYPKSIGGFPVKDVRDLTVGFDSSRPDHKPILPVSSSSQMITFYFENGAVVTLRGSGTEPKLKYYCELNGADRAEVDRQLTGVKEGIIHELLQPAENGLLPPND